MTQDCKKRRILTCTAILLWLFFYFAPISYGEDFTHGNHVTDYVYDATVNKDGTVDVQETFNYFFSSPSHGMLRELPRRGFIYMDKANIDNVLFDNSFKESASDFDMKLPTKTTYENLTVSGDTFDQSNSFFGNNKNIVLKIGNPDVEITGDKKYVINYKMVPRVTMPAEFDFIALSIVPENKRDPYEKASFVVRLPKVDGFNPEKNIHISGNKDVSYQVNEKDGQVIVTGSVDLLSAHNQNAFRLIAIYPKGTFALPSMNTYLYGILAVAIIFMISSIILWFLIGRDDPVINVIEFTPPDNMDPLKMSMLYNEKMPKISVAIVYLAALGLISISDVEKKGKDALITVPKSYDQKQQNAEKQLPSYMRNILNACKEEAGENHHFFVKCCSDNFWEKIHKESLHAGTILSGTLSNTYTGTSKLVAMLFMVALLPIMAAILSITTFTLIGLIAGVIIAIISMILSIKATNRKFGKIFAIFSGLIAGAPIGFGIYYYFSDLVPAIIAGAAIGIGAFFTGFIYKPTDEGTKMKGRIAGFRQFISIAEKEKIKALYDADPNYCLLILPYAYAFGIGSKWIDKVSAAMPKDFNTSNYSSYDTFLRVGMFNYYYNSYVDTLYNNNSSSTGSTFSGGGFSGGGFGGGGSGSW